MPFSRGAALILSGVLIGAGLLAGAPNEQKFRTRLAPVAIDVAMRANIAGSGTASAILAGNKLTVTGSFDGLLSPATAAHLNMGPAAGVRGPAVFDITVSTAKSGTISGTLNLTAEQIEALRKGKFYVLISSERAPDGNLWGWLMSTK